MLFLRLWNDTDSVSQSWFHLADNDTVNKNIFLPSDK